MSLQTLLREVIHFGKFLPSVDIDLSESELPRQRYWHVIISHQTTPIVTLVNRLGFAPTWVIH